jgi:uncharacterized protein with PQ loop repeat
MIYTFVDYISYQFSSDEEASLIFGFISIGLWVIAFLPQIHSNYQKKRCSLTIGLLGQWLIGDACNFVGVMIIDNLLVVRIVAIYYLIIDGILLSQYYKYEWSNQQKAAPSLPKNTFSHSYQEQDYTRKKTSSLSNRNRYYNWFYLSVIIILVLAISLWLWKCIIIEAVPSNEDTSDLSAFRWPPRTELLMFGYIIGVLSNFFYFVSRLPQIYENIKQKKTEGCFLFCIDSLANAAFIISLLSYSKEYAYLAMQAPWIIGSLIVLIMDLLLIYQFIIYDLFRKQSMQQSQHLGLYNA